MVSFLATVWTLWAPKAPLVKNMRSEPWAARAHCARTFARRPITYMHTHKYCVSATDSSIEVPGRAHSLYPPGHMAPSAPVKSNNLVDLQGMHRASIAQKEYKRCMTAHGRTCPSLDASSVVQYTCPVACFGPKIPDTSTPGRCCCC